MNLIETRTIGNLILNKNTPERTPRVEHFLIPYYQRGYRWEKNHVEALLDDIHNFILSKEENYCLQPIVVTLREDEKGLNIWEVIDGQQRLITLFIIFQFIQKAKYSIYFEQRGQSTDFLSGLNNETYNHDNPDFHFMSDAHDVVEKWFENKTIDDISYIDEFYTTVTKKVQVIWYQIPELNDDGKIDIFNRLNVGKIPLTDSELIRALLLSKIKYGLSERESDMRQAEISNEWNIIETELRREELWYFLNNDPRNKLSSHIEFIFKIIADDNAKKYSTFLWFEKEIKNDDPKIESDNARDLWDKTKSNFAKFKSWYNNRTLYHLIGYLLINDISLKHILLNSKTSKPIFNKWLVSQIKENIKGIKINDLKYRDKNLDKMLLLFNILSVENLTDTLQNRFPFNHYKTIKFEDGGWSIEHIHAQQSEQLKDEKAIKSWLEETLKAIVTITKLEKVVQKEIESGEIAKTIEIIDIQPYIKRIEDMLKLEKIELDNFNNLKNEIIQLFDSSSVHEIDNLALLSKKDNSTLNNSIFPVKRNKIINLEKEGKFIPMCTRNVFLKFYSNSDNQPYYWSSTDKESYLKSIKETLKPYLN
jgi:uncharacterized protein with ParB-like and HNH nuclease domain